MAGLPLGSEVGKQTLNCPLSAPTLTFTDLPTRALRSISIKVAGMVIHRAGRPKIFKGTCPRRRV